MATQDSQFIDGIPEHYQRFLVPVIFAPYSDDLAARLAASNATDVLEVACGTGAVTHRLLGALPGGTRWVATDLNDAMLEIARRRLGNTPGVTWSAADGTVLPFDESVFDAVVCQFGVMFFPDKALGMKEARRVLKPEGRYIFNVWDGFAANAFGRIAHETIASFFPSDPPAFYQTPFGFADEPAIRALLATAGFGSVVTERVRQEAVSRTARDFAIGLVRGNPVVQAIAERGVDPEHVIDAVEKALIREGGDRPFRSSMQALVVTAKA